MRYPVLFIFLVLSIAATAQNLTGVWRGTFSENGVLNERYKYEVQIKQKPDKSFNGVTYSYLTTIFYGKAACQGIYMDKVNNVVLKETKMLDLRTQGNSTANVMTCYLSYRKEGNTEYLEGTYSSVSVTDGRLGNSGKVTLKRVPDSDFQLEDFLVGSDKVKKGGIKPGAEANLLPRSNNNAGKQPLQPLARNRKAPHADSVIISKPGEDLSLLEAPPARPLDAPKKFPVPEVLSKRTNKLVKTFVTNSPDIKIQLYDNGEIDNDTVTVYHNNAPVVFRKRLSYDPLTINVTASATDTVHEFVMVADNLGSIPPNSAYMVIFTGGKRYELSVAADLKQNAKIVIEYKP